MTFSLCAVQSPEEVSLPEKIIAFPALSCYDVCKDMSLWGEDRK